MHLGAVLYFDADTEKRLAGVTGELRALGTPEEALPFRPHISLAAWSGRLDERLTAEVQSFAQEEHPLQVQLSAVGLFPTSERVIYLAPVVTMPLLELHQRWHARLAGLGIASANLYSPGQWVPHCTIALQQPPENTPRNVAILHKHQVFAPAQLMSIGLVEFPPVKELESFRFTLADG